MHRLIRALGVKEAAGCAREIFVCVAFFWLCLANIGNVILENLRHVDEKKKKKTVAFFGCFRFSLVRFGIMESKKGFNF